MARIKEDEGHVTCKKLKGSTVRLNIQTVYGAGRKNRGNKVTPANFVTIAEFCLSFFRFNLSKSFHSP